MKSKYFLASAAAAFIALSAFIYSDPLGDKITKALDNFSSKFPQEKVYLQFDKDYYASGEVIWFKAYIMSQGSPVFLNQNLYVELIDQKGKILQRNKLPVNAGGSEGDFELPDNFAAGNYRIRAYTSWMLNFDPAFLFHKDIRVFNPNAPQADTAIAKASAGQADAASGTVGSGQYAVQFFPEGGDLVQGIKSTVAFKAIDHDGMPVDVTGKVLDNTGKEITTLASTHDGMGSFELTPEANQSYQAVFTKSNGTTQTFPLPAAKASGIVLHVFDNINNNGRVFFHIDRSVADAATYNQLKLVGQMQNQLVYMASINFEEGNTGGMIPVSEFPSGIMQLTVFKEDGTPLAERLTFLENDSDILKMQVDPQTLNLEPRAKNTFKLTVPDALKGNFSVSVTDADQAMTYPGEGNILSNLLLTSDIKGYVNNPGWYFRDRDPATLKALSLVMMTNGWRRFEWEKILNNQFPSIKFPIERGIEIKGQTFEKDGKQTLSTGTVSMILKAPADTMTYFITAPVNLLGNFEVTGLSFHDTASVYYQGNDDKRKGRNVDVKFFGNFADNLNYVLLQHPIRPAGTASSRELMHFITLSAERNRINRLINSRTIYLKEVNITATKVPKEQSTMERYASPLFSGADGYTFDLTKDPANGAYFNIFQFLQARVPGLMISGDMSSPTLSWRGGSPALFLDEMPADAQMLSTVNINDVAVVKVIRPPFVGAIGGGGNGAIAVYTKKGGDNDDASTRGLNKTRVAGYTIVRQFYSPDYSVSKPVNELPDKRVTLYWNPLLATDTLTHTATFSFYNTDVTKRFRVVVEGIDGSGKIGRVEKVFQ